MDKMDSILNDPSKFKPFRMTQGKELNEILKYEKSLKTVLKPIFNKGILHQDIYNKPVPVGSKPGRLYSLSKVHKPGAALRLSLSAINKPSFALAKFLVPILSPITSNAYTVKDSFSFAEEISAVKSDGLYIATFSSFHREVVYLKSILRLNGYPLSLIDCCIEKFLNKVYQARLPLDTVAKKSVSLLIPYTGVASMQVRQKILAICRKFLPQVDCKVVLLPFVRLTHFFPFKDRFLAALDPVFSTNFCPEIELLGRVAVCLEFHNDW